jgi:hypothetical protein
MRCRVLTCAVTALFLLVAVGCSGDSEDAHQNSPNEVCASSCAKKAEQDCLGELTVEVCEKDCLEGLDALPACKPEMAAAAQCLVDEGDVCSVNTYVAPAACDDEFAKYGTCWACVVADGADACQSCEKTKCCAARKKIYAHPDLFAYSRCRSACAEEDQACFAACDEQYASVNDALNEVSACILEQCQTECTDDPAS